MTPWLLPRPVHPASLMMVVRTMMLPRLMPTAVLHPAQLLHFRLHPPASLLLMRPYLDPESLH